jgi:hypothetical protein
VPQVLNERGNLGRLLQAPGRGNGRVPPGLARRFKQRKGDLMDCQDQNQQTVLVLRSAIMIRNLSPRSQNSTWAEISIDSADASVQRLKLNWHKRQTEQ